jgi:hypothetical protein
MKELTTIAFKNSHSTRETKKTRQHLIILKITPPGKKRKQGGV